MRPFLKVFLIFWVASSVLGFVVFLVFLLGVWLPTWNEMGERHKKMEQHHQEFDKRWNRQ